MARNSDLATFDQVVFSIYQAALDPSRWQYALDEIRLAGGGLRTHMFGFDGSATLALGNMWSGYDPAFIDSYRAHYGNVSPRAKGFLRLQPGEVIGAGELAPTESYLRSEMYNDWVRPQENMIGGGGGVLLRDRHRMLVFGGNIRAQDRDRLEGKWLTLARRLMPHLRQAFALSRTLGTEFRPFASQTGAPVAATLLLTEDGYPLDANDAALELIERGAVLSSNVSGHVSFTNPTASAILEQSLKALRRGHPVSTTFSAGPDAGGNRHTCRLIHFMPHEFSAPQILLSMRVVRPCLLLTISSAANDTNADQAFAAHYRLTRAELAVVQGLANGLSLTEVAESRRVSIHTVREQLKAALNKTESRRQSDLVRLVTSARNLQ